MSNGRATIFQEPADMSNLANIYYVPIQDYNIVKNSGDKLTTLNTSLPDWSSPIVVQFFYGDILITTRNLLFLFSHNKTKSIELQYIVVSEENSSGVITSHIVPGDCISFEGRIVYNVEHYYAGAHDYEDFNYYISKMYYPNGKEVDKEGYDKYAYFLEGGVYLQLTDLIEAGFIIEVYAEDERDDVVSNFFSFIVSHD
jgi:hypothetical protein